MQFKTYCIIFLLGLWALQGCDNSHEGTTTVKGNFTNAVKTKFFIYQILPESKSLVDSLNTDENGDFRLSLKLSETGFYSLQSDNSNEITLILTPGEELTIRADALSLRQTYYVEGSKESELYTVYNTFTLANLDKVDSLSQVFADIRSNPDFQQLKKRLDSAYMAIFDDQKQKVISFVENNPESLASLLAISNNFGPNPLLSEQSHPDLFLKLDSTLMIAYPDNSLVKSFHTQMLEVKAQSDDFRTKSELLKPGMPAPSIILPDANGKEIRLSAMRGKLTLVYFWGSWNALSRQTNMRLTNLFTKYHAGGFEIFAVSIDSDPDLWKKAYLLDKAYWIHVNDKKGLESEYCKIYAVRTIPALVLIGKNGNIISRNPEFGELEELIKSNL